MLRLTRLNGTSFWLNPDLLMLVEATPDTVILLTNGERLLVQEVPEAIMQAFVAYKQTVGGGPSLRGSGAASASLLEG
jgi:flagellar protein FlbD